MYINADNIKLSVQSSSSKSSESVRISDFMFKQSPSKAHSRVQRRLIIVHGQCSLHGFSCLHLQDFTAVLSISGRLSPSHQRMSYQVDFWLSLHPWSSGSGATVSEEYKGDLMMKVNKLVRLMCWTIIFSHIGSLAAFFCPDKMSLALAMSVVLQLVMDSLDVE